MPVSSKEEYEKRLAANPDLLKIYRDIWNVDIMLLGIGYLTGPLPGFRALASQELGLTAEDLAARLKEGNPSVWTYQNGPAIYLSMLTVADGDELVIAQRLHELAG
jgi:hypothetical protein